MMNPLEHMPFTPETHPPISEQELDRMDRLADKLAIQHENKTARLEDRVKTLEAEAEEENHDKAFLLKTLERLEEKHYIDPLTGLSNRRGLGQAYGRIQNARRNHRRETEFSPEDEKIDTMVFIDIDGFKQVNDTLGHDAGDQILIEVGEILTGLIRTDDTAARFGGDEFVLLLQRITPERLQRLSQEIRSKIEHLGAYFTGVTASIGIARIHDREEFESILKQADAAMYSAKAKGKNQVIYFEDIEATAKKVK
jgi:diguanylate cyclase (GGDEF)-like protein